MRVTDRTATAAELKTAVDSAANVVGRESLGNVYLQSNLPNLTLRVHDSRGKMARRAPSGRRTVGATWEAHRIFLDVLFTLRPTARVRTALTTYRGAADFYSRHKETRRANWNGRTAFGTL
jgi:hypothetical protein